MRGVRCNTADGRTVWHPFGLMRSGLPADWGWVGVFQRLVIDGRPLRIRSFRRLWMSSIVTAVGGTLTQVAVPVQIYTLTGSSAFVGLSALVSLGPLVVFGLWGGAFADVVDRRRLMLVTNAGLGLVSILFFAQAAVGMGSVAVLFVLVAVQSGLFGANMPARGATIPRLVPPELLPAANALGAVVRRFATITGPLLAGALIPLIGLRWLYFIDAVGLCLAVALVWGLPALPPRDTAPKRASVRNIVKGFAYLAKQPILLVAYLADSIAMVFGMSAALFPQLATQTFGGPPGGGFALGLLYAATDIGGVITGAMSGSFTRFRRHGLLVTLSVCTWGLAMVGFGFSGWLWLAVTFLALSGAAMFVLSVFRTAILQAVTTDEMRGRMEGANIVIIAGGPQVGSFAHGLAGAAVGTTWAISGGGVMVVLATLALVAAVPSFWRYRSMA